MNDIEKAIEEYAQAYHYRAIGLHAHGCEDAIAKLRALLASTAVPVGDGVKVATHCAYCGGDEFIYAERGGA